MTRFATIDQLSVAHKVVLLRADLNVPMQDGRVTDNARLTRLRPTLDTLSRSSARIVVLSHFGRPEGTRNLKYSLRPVATALEKIWGRPIAFAEDCVGQAAKSAIDKLKDGEILVLENTRFHKGEEGNDPAFAQQLAELGDIFVNDAFSAAHRAHASTEALAHLLPSAAGKLMEAELCALAKALTSPERPLAALVGGSKISTKLDLLQNLVSKVDALILGGGMANTFLAADGVAIGKSLYEADMLETAKAIKKKADQKGCKILLPIDGVVASKLALNVETQTVNIQAVPSDQMVLDIGPKSVAQIIDVIQTCKTLVWNGPLGAFEFPPFDLATTRVAQAVAELTLSHKLLSVAGGGDTVSALTHAGVLEKMSYVSAAGGAFLEWLEGKTLPGVTALEKSEVDEAARDPKMGMRQA